ncbi:hypothetical protein DFH09DRAFT_1338875 [Mycena vulgaris]|nr:hypothetical protein DFH09DRAFT_1338875 [Mycena vulgaris]
MSLSIQGQPVTSFTFAPVPRTLISGSLALRLPPPRESCYLFTVTTASWGSFSFTLSCSQSFAATHDVILGHDWAGHFRDFLLHSGFRLPSSFDSWAYLISRPPSFPSNASPTPVPPIPFPAFGLDRSRDLVAVPLGHLVDFRSSVSLPALESFVGGPSLCTIKLLHLKLNLNLNLNLLFAMNDTPLLPMFLVIIMGLASLFYLPLPRPAMTHPVRSQPLLYTPLPLLLGVPSRIIPMRALLLLPLGLSLRPLPRIPLVKLAGMARNTAFLLNPLQQSVSEEDHAKARWINALCPTHSFELHLVPSTAIGNSFIYKTTGADRPTYAFVHGEVMAIESRVLDVGDSLTSPTDILSIRVLDRATEKTRHHFARDVETLVDVMVSEYSEKTVIAHEWASPGPDGNFNSGTYALVAYSLEVIHPAFLRVVGVISRDLVTPDIGLVDGLTGEMEGLVV